MKILCFKGLRERAERHALDARNTGKSRLTTLVSTSFLLRPAGEVKVPLEKQRYLERRRVSKRPKLTKTSRIFLVRLASPSKCFARGIRFSKGGAERGKEKKGKSERKQGRSCALRFEPRGRRVDNIASHKSLQMQSSADVNPDRVPGERQTR